MRFFLTSLLILSLCAAGFPAYQQQLIPVIREVKTSAASISEWKAYLRVTDIGGATYVSLVQVADILNGQLRWHPVSQSVNFAVRGQQIKFAYNSPQVLINGRRQPLGRPTVKNEDGF